MTKPLYHFRSGFERQVYNEAVANAGELEFEPRDKHLFYNRPSQYIPDFVLSNGIIVECKGRFTSADRTKMLRVRRENPFSDIRFVFQRANNRLTKSKNSSTYWEWCERHGFMWAEGNIPVEWLREEPS